MTPTPDIMEKARELYDHVLDVKVDGNFGLTEHDQWLARATEIKEQRITLIAAALAEARAVRDGYVMPEDCKLYNVGMTSIATRQEMGDNYYATIIKYNGKHNKINENFQGYGKTPNSAIAAAINSATAAPNPSKGETK